MNTIQFAITAVFAACGLSLVRLAVVIFLQSLAIRTFWRCLSAAKDAGVDRAFMKQFNTQAQYGDSLESIIFRWGSRRIRHMYTAAIAR
ncbi:hypothetical protein [Brucella cytisi]|uniref:Uncharacterized protein n=1 Tax=Brucella cytisi TaxID=407152 RepID=A0A1J6HCV4_9HYPH|nr:hypothetical protein [Brucella cytisi]OIS90211.1 hypothetical protein BLA27_27980 [Brucella cytisi]